MKTMREYFVEHLEEDFHSSRQEFKLQVPLGEKEFDAIYDPYNERLKIFGITGKDYRNGSLDTEFIDPASYSGVYTKLSIYSYPGDKDIWHALGFTFEGNILGFYEKSTNAVVWTQYQDFRREKHPIQTEHAKIIESARSKIPAKPALKKGYTCDIVPDTDSSKVARLMKNLFDDYPTPLSSRRIKELIKSEKSLFRCVRNSDGEIVAVASAEIDHDRGNAEMSDCATLPEERRKGHMVYILDQLEQDLIEKYDITDLYTLARAGETGINYTFAKLGYIYTGRLFNNCRMPGGWESMNIWCKNNNTTVQEGE